MISLSCMGQDSDSLVVFQDKKIRRVWHNEEWYFSVIDVIETLTESSNPRNYWNMLKSRELEHGIELYTYCVQLKLPSPDGKLRETDCANTKAMFRLIQSIPSQKAEPQTCIIAMERFFIPSRTKEGSPLRISNSSVV